MIKEITMNNVKILDNSFINIDFITNELKNNPFAKIIIYIDNKVKGYLYYSDIYDRIEINQIEVHTPYRNQKIASKLIEELLKKNKEITLEVNKNNVIALALYKKYGFKEIAIRKGYYNGIDAILMKKGK